MSHALARLSLRTPAGAPCQVQSAPLQIAHHVDGAYARLPLTVACAGAPATLDLHYDLFFDRDAQHRAILDVPPHTAILSATSRQQSIALTSGRRIG